MMQEYVRVCMGIHSSSTNNHLDFLKCVQTVALVDYKLRSILQVQFVEQTSCFQLNAILWLTLEIPSEACGNVAAHWKERAGDSCSPPGSQ